MTALLSNWEFPLPRSLRDRLRRCTANRGARTTVLMYHRVIDLPSDPQRLAVRPAHFAQHLDVLRNLTETVTLAEAVARCAEPLKVRPRVALTFDDGYADNAWFAAPLLRSRETPATVFVTTGAVDGKREFWWDELERNLLCPRSLPPTLEMEVEGKRLRWETPAEPSSGVQGWHVQSERPPNARQAAYLGLMRVMTAQEPEVRNRLLDDLTDWSGQGRLGRESHRPLTRSELLGLSAAGGGIVLGAHTVSHPVLSRLAQPRQFEQIASSRRWLREMTGLEPADFSYPHGGRQHYTAATVRCVREAGFTRACTTEGRPLGMLDDPLELPRWVVRDWNGAEFETRLREWLNR